MAEIVKQVRKPHDCGGELSRQYGMVPSAEYYIGTIAKCSCGQHYRVAENQYEGFWEPMTLMPPTQTDECVDCGPPATTAALTEPEAVAGE